MLLVDEVDIFFGEKFYGQTYNPAFEIENTYLSDIYIFIWENR